MCRCDRGDRMRHVYEQEEPGGHVTAGAASVSLPSALPDGRMFPQRSMIIYLAFCLIVATLVVQGLTLPWLIRRLGLTEPVRIKDEEQEARRVLLREALVHLDRNRSKNRDLSAMFGE